MSTSQFYLYGRSHFTATGWEKARAKYPSPDPLDAVNLAGKVFVVTGANSGLGKEISSFLAKRGGKVYMVCRSEQRAAAARNEIMAESQVSPDNVITVQGDCGLKSDVHRVTLEIMEKEPNGLHGLVCNAGALLNTRTLTSEGIETTFACHLGFGSYLLSKLLQPALRKAGGQGRVLFVSSGGMYNTKVPAWNLLSGADDVADKYDGTLAYAFAKRGQVVLAEKLAEAEAKIPGSARVTYVSAHPGWSATPGVDAAFGDKSKWLQPMRTPWQGAEGMCWLMQADTSEIVPGSFYLDRQPQCKHIAGPFFSEGSYTKNTDEEITAMLAKLAEVAGVKFECNL